jgi:hypothetical protein
MVSAPIKSEIERGRFFCASFFFKRIIIDKAKSVAGELLRFLGFYFFGRFLFQNRKDRATGSSLGEATRGAVSSVTGKVSMIGKVSWVLDEYSGIFCSSVIFCKVSAFFSVIVFAAAIISSGFGSAFSSISVFAGGNAELFSSAVSGLCCFFCFANRFGQIIYFRP